MLGFDQIGSFGYFYRVRRALENDGYRVYASKVDPFNTVAIRAGQLDQFIESVLAKTGADKVHIIAHSMGGLDARYVISQLKKESSIASLSMIGTPNYGTLIADKVLEELDSRKYHCLLILQKLVGIGESRFMQKVREVARDLSVGWIKNRFNPAVRDSDQVFYQSWAGISSPFIGGSEDWMLPVLQPLSLLLQSWTGDNDGLVSVASQKWGKFNGTIPADHLDEVGQPFGGSSYTFHHIKFYRHIASTLRKVEAMSR
ncbi:MAG: alpha/beta hydrolase [Bdellovibrionota bacterium]